jgi:hypothetical protein
MELTNEFEVAVPVEQAWAVLTDLERIAPCLPGAQLREVQGDEYRGSVKIKVGPITTSYDGVIQISELDASTHRAVLKAEGRETRGQGNVASVITATMFPTDVGTKVVVATDLTITGKVAQFGRGVLADVSAKLLDQFVVNLESMVLVPGDIVDDSMSDETVSTGDSPTRAPSKKRAPASKSSQADTALTDAATAPEVDGIADEVAPSSDAIGAVRQINSQPAEPVDIISLAGGSVTRRVVRPLVFAALALVVVRLARRRTK